MFFFEHLYLKGFLKYVLFLRGDLLYFGCLKVFLGLVFRVIRLGKITGNGRVHVCYMDTVTGNLTGL